jgi:hypothetical protein
VSSVTPKTAFDAMPSPRRFRHLGRLKNSMPASS